jgi:hypothetical protein
MSGSFFDDDYDSNDDSIEKVTTYSPNNYGSDERDEEANNGLSGSNYFNGEYTDPTTGEKINYNELFNPLGGNTNFGKGLAVAKHLLSGKSEYGALGQSLGIAALSSLFNKVTGGGLGQSGQGVYKGYQGGIPKYTASRQQYAMPTDGKPSTYNPSNQEIKDYLTRPGLDDAMVTRNMNQFGITPERLAGITGLPAANINSRMQAAMGPNLTARRPGSGGVTYFSPMQYTKAGAAPAAPVTPPAQTAAVTTPPVDETGKTWDYAAGGISTLGGYSDGGRLLRGPGDGVSDSIPATIGNRQPARLADGEFVIPARIVSELGNGSTEAGAKKLYAMMDRVQNARKKTTKNVAANTKAEKYLPS